MKTTAPRNTDALRAAHLGLHHETLFGTAPAIEDPATREALRILAAKLAACAPEADPGRIPAAGDIWIVEQPQPAPIVPGEGAVRTPPAVFVLQIRRGMALCLQVHETPALAGPSDIPLAEPGWEHTHLEPWNLYSVPVERLHTYAGRVRNPAQTCLLAHQAAQEGDFHDAPRGSLVHRFRVLEIAVGAAYALPWAMEAVQRWEAGG